MVSPNPPFFFDDSSINPKSPVPGDGLSDQQSAGTLRNNNHFKPTAVGQHQPLDYAAIVREVTADPNGTTERLVNQTLTNAYLELAEIQRIMQLLLRPSGLSEKDAESYAYFARRREAYHAFVQIKRDAQKKIKTCLSLAEAAAVYNAIREYIVQLEDDDDEIPNESVSGAAPPDPAQENIKFVNDSSEEEDAWEKQEQEFRNALRKDASFFEDEKRMMEMLTGSYISGARLGRLSIIASYIVDHDISRKEMEKLEAKKRMTSEQHMRGLALNSKELAALAKVQETLSRIIERHLKMRELMSGRPNNARRA